MVNHPPKFRFYLDENFPVPAGDFLKSLGHHVEYGIGYFKKEGISDDKHIKAATKLGAILLAYDRDFIVQDDLVEKIRMSPGAVIIEATSIQPETTQRILRKILKQLSYPKISGKICQASIDKITYI